MITVGPILLQDQRAAFARQVERAASGGSVIAAFAWYWLRSSPSVQVDPAQAVTRACSAKGAARTFREVAVLGYAIAAGQTQAEVVSAFSAGLQQLAGRDLSIVGTHAPVCGDSVSLLGLALGHRGSAAAPALGTWIQEACRIGGTSERASKVDCALARLASSVASGGPATTIDHPPLLLAACAQGLVGGESQTEQVASDFLKSLAAQVDVVDEEAILSLAALEWLLRASAIFDLATPSVRAVCDVLRRTHASLHRWVFEEQPKTKGATPRQWHIDNEYHAQSLLWAVLSPLFPDLREEEWLTSVGQKKPRADLCLPTLRLIIEVKFWRHGTKVQDLIEEVAADTGLYLGAGSPYSRIVVYIWDDTSSADQHYVLVQGLRNLNGVVDVVIQARPSRFGVPASAAKKKVVAKP